MANNSTSSSDSEKNAPLYTVLNHSLESKHGESIEKSVIKLAMSGKVDVQAVCNLLRRNGKLTQGQVEALMELVQEQHGQKSVTSVIGNGNFVAEQKATSESDKNKPDSNISTPAP